MAKLTGSHKKSKKTEQARLAKEIFGVLLVVMGILFGICVFSDSETVVLMALREFAFGSLGVMGYICPVIFILWGSVTIFADKLGLKTGTAVMTLVGILSLIALIHLLSPYGEVKQGSTFGEYLWFAIEKGYKNAAGGGFIGALMSYVFAAFLGKAAGAVVLIALMLISIMVVCHISIKSVGNSIGRQVKRGAHIAASRIREEAPIREERLRKRVERDAFIYDSEPESQYPKGTVYNELLEERADDTPAAKEELCYEEIYDKDDAEYYSEELVDDAELYPFDTQSEYELKDDSVIQSEEENTSAELDLGGLRIVSRLHENSTGMRELAKKTKSRSYDFTVEQHEKPKNSAVYDDKAAYIEDEYSNSDIYSSEDVLIEEEDYTQEQEVQIEPNNEIEEMPEKNEAVNESKKADLRVIRPEAKTSERKESDKFTLPSMELLDKPKYTSDEGQNSRREMDECAKRLEDTFHSFGVDIRVVDASRGPKVTRYELQPAAGVKIAKIKSLGDDIALNMAAESVRIEAPIPGKSVIGIELPNKTYASVCLRELIDCPEFSGFRGELPFALGKDIAGKKIYDDLAKMPHLLVAGTTGSGKSVCLNTIIMSLMYRLPPSELQFIMIDPKMVEMAVYNDIPNLKVPVVMDKAKAAGALVWAVNEMENRYKLFKTAGVRNIKTYNQKRREAGEETMAKLVIVIDEFADLMMVSAKDVEDAVCRIAQLGRAAGIHLIIATQSPRADIFTGLIKANVPSRIALTVGNALESRIIMDEMGAEKLLGYGDMLYRPIGKNKATRVQGCFVSDDEIYRVTSYLKSNGEAEYDNAIDDEMTKLAYETGKNKQENTAGADNSDMDELLPQAVETILEFDQASASMLQRKMRVGYSRAARLMDQLEEIGAVGPSEGSKGRQILWTWADYNERFGENMHDEEYDYEN